MLYVLNEKTEKKNYGAQQNLYTFFYDCSDYTGIMLKPWVALECIYRLQIECLKQLV